MRGGTASPARWRNLILDVARKANLIDSRLCEKVCQNHLLAISVVGFADFSTSTIYLRHQQRCDHHHRLQRFGRQCDHPHTTNGYPVTAIESNAFYYQTAVTSVTIPDSVGSIGNFVFTMCFGLTNVVIGNNVTNIGPGAFESCYALASMVVPNSVVNFGAGAFDNCSGLSSVVLGNSVVNLGQSAFGSCTSLGSVTIPNSVTNIDKDVFYNCSALTNITIGNQVTSIGRWAFRQCRSLTNIIIPSSVTYIGSLAFASCSSLHQIHFEGNAPTSGGTIFFVEPGTVYYLPGTLGWGTNYDGPPTGWPTAQWYQPQPQILGSGYGLGVQSNRFQFTISWATNTSVVMDASTNLHNWYAGHHQHAGQRHQPLQ